MRAFVLLMLVAGAMAMPYGPVVSGWGAAPVAVAHAAPVAYAQPQYVKQIVQPQYVHAAPVAYAQPQYVKQVVQPQYVHAAPVVKHIAPAASSYSTFSQTHVSHPAPIVKVHQPVAYAQPVVKVAQPVAYAQPVVKVAQPVVSHYVSQPLSHGW